jgi:exosortase E/protease (VPEID-CTERM system)
LRRATPAGDWRIPGELGLAARAAILGALFFAEKFFLTQFVDLQRADAALGIGEHFRIAQHFGFRFIVALLAALVVFGFGRGKPSQTLLPQTARFRPAWLAAHVALIACLVPLSARLFPPTPSSIPFLAVVCLWLVCGAAAVFCAFVAMAAPGLWVKAARTLGNIWFYSITAALAAAAAIPLTQELWRSTSTATFFLVRLVLLPILPGLTADPARRVLGTDNFAVEILEFCSGLEGMSLILVFTIAWLWYFRKDYRFPRALLLIPFGVTLMFALNVARIAVLVLVGNAGYQEVAVYGFHSQAGWIAFNGVAVGIAVWTRGSRWLNRSVEALEANQSENPTSVFLVPLLAILAAGMISHSLSGKFEWFYPLRVVACFAVIMILRHRLAALDWHWSWRGPLLGAGVFIVWRVGVHFLVPNSGMPEALTFVSPSVRWGWILCRVAGTVLTVPVAEELAYRGFLMRRLQAREFDSLPYERVGWFAVVVSAVLFGAAHAALWLPGSLAGLAYGWIVKRRGHLGEAVTAHMTTNLLVATVALGSGNWAGF